MTELTREERVQALYDLKVGQVLSQADIENVKMLARAQLAAVDSEPVAVVEPSDYVTAAQLVGERPARKAVHELYEGALRIGDKLYRHAQPSLVPDKMTYQDGVLFVLNNDMSSIERGTVAMRAWNACRAAMLQGAENAESRCSNSPVIPGGCVMVPKEPTDEMIAAAMNCDDVLFNSDESFCVQFGNIYEAMLAAAPHDIPALNSVQSVATVPGKWIPVSERMPEEVKP